MARNMNSTFVVLLIALATFFNGSVAQTRHVVGDSSGWIIPSGGAATYTTWASNKTFTIGDTLVFNFATGVHDVAKVTKSEFEACNGGNATFTITTGPATVTLNETGEQYYICAVSGHCSFGQKLAIKVTEKASTNSNAPSLAPNASPSPKTSPVSSPKTSPVSSPKTSPVASPRTSPVSSPKTSPVASPSVAPAPAPFTGPVTYTVGDTLGWTITSNGASDYVAWASDKNFKVGDILVFNYQINTHNVEEVTKEKFDSCSSVSPIAAYNNAPPVRVTLNNSGSHYFICGFTGHCSAGQKLAINVTGTTTTTTATSPSGDGGVSSPPPNSGAASVGSIGLFAILVSVAAAFH